MSVSMATAFVTPCTCAITEAVGTIVGWRIFDASGNALYWGDLAAGDQKAYGANDQFIFPAGALVITED